MSLVDAGIEAREEISFWEKVDKSAPDGCWLWKGARRGDGSGTWRSYSLRQDFRAHRLSWLLTQGPIPTGRIVRQSCGNPLCVVPAHLKAVIPGSEVWTEEADQATGLRASEIERFWAKVDKTGGVACWNWTASTNSRGYGNFRSATLSKGFLAHRLSWVLSRGPLSDDRTIDHLCENRLCVNPAHLEPVTLRVNAWRGSGERRRRWGTEMGSILVAIANEPTGADELISLQRAALLVGLSEGKLRCALQSEGLQSPDLRGCCTRSALRRLVILRGSEDLDVTAG